MASFFNRVWSGLDFWDAQENKAQRDEFAQQKKDEEERKKREQAARASVVVSPTPDRASSFNRDPNLAVATTSPLEKVGSQSQYDFDTKLQKVVPVDNADVNALPTKTDAPQSSNWFKRNLSATGLYNIGKEAFQGVTRIGPKIVLSAQDLADRYGPTAGIQKKMKEDYTSVRSAMLNSGLSENDPKVQELDDAYAQTTWKRKPVITPDTPLMKGIFGDAPIKTYSAEAQDLNNAIGNEGTKWATPIMAASMFGLDVFMGGKSRAIDQLVKETTEQGVRRAAEEAGIKLTTEQALKIAETGDKNIVKGVVDEASANTTSKVVNTVSEDAPDLPGSRQVDTSAGVSSIEVAPGVESTNLTKVNALRQEAADTEVPAYLRAPLKDEANTIERDVMNKRAESLGVGTDATGRPAYLHKQEIQDAIDSGQSELDDFINAHPEASVQELSAAKQSIEEQVLARIDELQKGRYGVSGINVPDVTDPIALAKVSGETANGIPMADFSKAVNVPLEKAPTELPIVKPTAIDIAQSAQKGDLPISTKTDLAGNPAMISDAQAQRQLADVGIAPQRGDSIVASEEERMAKAAEQAAREQVANVDASRARTTIADSLDDPALADDIMTNFENPERINIEATRNAAKQNLNDLSDEAIVSAYQNGAIVRTPQNYFEGVGSIRRIQNIDTPEARQAVANIMDAIDLYKTKGGQTLRVMRTLYEDMPTVMKADYLLKKLGSAGAELTDENRAVLVDLITKSDAATDSLRALEDRAKSMLDNGVINNTSMPENIRQQVADLTKQIDAATREKEIRAGDAWRFYQEQLPRTALGKRVGDVGRTFMLSAPSGRVFDIISTSATSADDLLTRSLSGLFGKAVNLVKGAGTVADTVANPRQLLKGVKEGAGRVKDSFKGKDFVEDFMGEARRATRGDVNTGGGVIRRTVRSAVELPTNMTRGLRTDELYRQGMQEAAQQGLKGDARQIYAELRAAVPDEKQLKQAVEAHMRANMLHNNKLSRFLSNIANSLDKGGNGWGAPLIRNQVAPFTSWLGGNVHRALTDKNILWNVGSIVNSARKGNAQGVVDGLSKFVVNSGEAYGAGVLLTRAGILTTTDANGNNYAGLYFHIGNRYIPVAAAGTVSIPLILGNAFQQGFQASEDGGNFAEAFINSLTMNTLKNTGVSSVFGGENNLQSTISSLASGTSDAADSVVKYVGDFVRQYIPAITGDINSILDNTLMNPTGEAANTKVTSLNPETGRQKTDALATEFATTRGRIPILSQRLDRQPGTNAKDFVDRITHGNSATGEMATKSEQAKSLSDMKKLLTKEGISTSIDDISGIIADGDYDKAEKAIAYHIAVMQADPTTPKSKIKKFEDQMTEIGLQANGVPVDKDGIQARVEDGDYDKAIAGSQYLLSKISSDKNTPKSDKEDLKDSITRLQVTKAGDYPPEVIDLYKSTSVTDWRKMGDDTDELYDPETFAILQKYDAALTKAGVSLGKFKDKNKYFASESGSGKKSIVTDIATQNLSKSFTPIKEQSANFATPSSAIPVLEKVKNNDTSKLRKISVTKGARL